MARRDTLRPGQRDRGGLRSEEKVSVSIVILTSTFDIFKQFVNQSLLFISSTTVFNRTDVVIDTINGTTGGRVLVSVKVKIPGMSGGILVPSIVVKKVIKSSTELIEKQTGLKVALDTATTITMSTTTSKPLTTGPSVDIKSTPTGSIIPGLTDYWAVIVCAIAATLLLLTITLCFTYHANRSVAESDDDEKDDGDDNNDDVR